MIVSCRSNLNQLFKTGTVFHRSGLSSSQKASHSERRKKLSRVVLGCKGYSESEIPVSSNKFELKCPQQNFTRRNAVCFLALVQGWQMKLGEYDSLALADDISANTSADNSADTSANASADMLALVEYTNTKDKYSMRRPEGWAESTKSGASVLFTDPKFKYNTVGVLVVPSRIQRIQQFGDLDFATDKVIQAEKSKPITQAVKLLSKTSYEGPTGTVYEIAYDVTTDYGQKTNIALVTVANGNLYNLNVQYGRGGSYGQASNELIASVKNIVQSFAII